MTNGYGGFCGKCGGALRTDQTFCSLCGTPRGGPTGGPPVGSPPASGPSTPSTLGSAAAGAGRAVSGASRAYGVVTQVAGMAGMGFSLPWQKVVGAGRPDVGAFLSTAALSGARQAIGGSLRRPGLALAATTVLDFAAAWITGGASAMYLAIPRLVISGSTSLLSVVTGSKGGRLRKITGIFAAVAVLAQLGFGAYTLITGLGDGPSPLEYVPQLVAMISGLVMAIKTMTVAFRRSR